MSAPLLTAVSVLLFMTVSNAIDINSQQVMPEMDFVDLISRDSEPLPGPLAFGHKFMTGGAGEGDQMLRPEDDFQPREEIKSDNVLPAYCEPPNPCPIGFTADDGCSEDFENTADFSRNYQAGQSCICDQEHMFSCPGKNNNGDEMDDESMQDVLDRNDLHKDEMHVIAKKFHEKRSEMPRRKRSVSPKHHDHVNPYLQGEPLRTVSKKNGQKTW